METLSFKSLKNISLLYVEDEKNIREKIADTLRYYVHEVFEAKDGVEGLAQYKQHRPDIILSDILMPHMDGIEMVTKIRQNDKNTPIILISAHTDKALLLHAVTLHLEEYLVKPVTLENILKSLEKSLLKVKDTEIFLHAIHKTCHYNSKKKLLINENCPIKLSKKEIDFLELLLQNETRVVTYNELQKQVWKDEVMTDNALRSLVFSLRNKLPKDAIKNLSGIGYKLSNE